MKHRALVSFSGAISMTKGEVREISNPTVVEDLLKAGYIEPAEGEKPKKTTTTKNK